LTVDSKNRLRGVRATCDDCERGTEHLTGLVQLFLGACRGAFAVTAIRIVVDRQFRLSRSDDLGGLHLVQ
jgi:hypothetical protein